MYKSQSQTAAWLSRVQPAHAAITSPCRKELSWSSAASIVHGLQLGCSFIHVDLNCMHLFRVCACLHKPFACCFTTRGDHKRNKIEIFWKNTCTVCFHLFSFSSYLKGLNVNRLLLAIVLPSAPPVIIFQNERPLTSLLISHQGTSGGQTFSPRPIQQRYTAAFTRVISHGHVSRRKK